MKPAFSLFMALQNALLLHFGTGLAYMAGIVPYPQGPSTHGLPGSSHLKPNVSFSLLLPPLSFFSSCTHHRNPQQCPANRSISVHLLRICLGSSQVPSSTPLRTFFNDTPPHTPAALLPQICLGSRYSKPSASDFGP